MKSVLITGCNRGIGLGLVKHLLSVQSPPKHIIATCRSIEKAEALNEISKQNSNVKILQIDLKNFDDYQNLITQVEKVVEDEGLNVLINNAGVSAKFTRVGLVKVTQMTDNFIVNTVAPLMLAKACLPLLKKASHNNNTLELGVSRAAIINISSILGSIHENTEGGFYPYRSSKAALNAVTRSLCADLKADKILVASIHPGWVKTDLGGANAPLEVDVAVPKLVNTLYALTAKHSGSFIEYDGRVLPW